MHHFRVHIHEHFRHFIIGIEYDQEQDQIPHDSRFVTFAPQLVVDAVEAFRGNIQPLLAASFHGNRTSIDQPPEQGRYGSDVHAGAGRDLAGARWPPEIDHREIDAAFGFCEIFQVGAKILGMVVDQTDQIFHQLAQGSMLCEPCDDDQETGVAAGQDLQRPDLPPTYRVAADRLPQASAVFGIQRIQADDSEQLEEGFTCIIQPLETAGGGSEQDDLGFRL